MKLSELLFKNTKELWDRSAQKPFVMEMAKGTLASDLFKRYMLQDYLYLQEYIGILKRIREFSESGEITSFLDGIIEEVIREVDRVHVPNMEELGITGDDIEKGKPFPVIAEYTGYMRSQVEEHGLLGGITALLQCSWVYAYIGKTVSEKYPEEIANSEYGSWFEAYTCDGYLDANNTWIDVLDKLGATISEEEATTMCGIFTKCAQYENELWDALYLT